MRFVFINNFNLSKEKKINKLAAHPLCFFSVPKVSIQ